MSTKTGRKNLYKDPNTGNYIVSFSYEGTRYRRSTGTDKLSKAVADQDEVDDRLRAYKGGFVDIDEDVSVNDFVFEGKRKSDQSPDVKHVRSFFRDYMKHAKSRKADSTITTEKIHINHLREFLENEGAEFLSDLDVRLFEKYVNDFRSDVADVTKNKELSTFRYMLNKAIDWGYLNENAITKVGFFQDENSALKDFRTVAQINRMLERGDYTGKEIESIWRHCYLTQDELSELLSLCRPERDLYVFAQTCAYTGGRFSEIMRLRWEEDIDFEYDKITIRDTKRVTSQTESSRKVDLHPKLKKILKSYDDYPKKYIFVRPDKEISQGKNHMRWQLEKVRRKTKFSGIGFHAIRHTFGSILAKKGVRLPVISEYMGHITDEMQKHYLHISPTEKKAAINEMPTLEMS